MWSARTPVTPVDNADVRFAIDQLGKWIANADAKAGLLGAALAVLASAVAQQARVVAHRLPPGSLLDWASLLGFVVSASAVAMSSVFVLRAVSPVVTGSAQFSRYSWSSLADAPLDELMAQTDACIDREQGWAAATLLASIARRKFSNLRRAFRLGSVAAFVFVTVAAGNLVR
jgi:hypothetical protein